MANNRLYIGNKETKEILCIAKSEGDTWRKLKTKDLPKLNNMLVSDGIWSETQLVLFSENDTEMFNYFFKDPDRIVISH